MKYLISGLMAIALLAGCATQKQVSSMEGKGTRVVYNAPYDRVWRAAVDAAQIQDLTIRTADPGSGYITAGRGMQVTTFGENVGIWVKEVVPGQTQVEVVSRQAGPPALTFKSWENRILNALAANLTREGYAAYY